MPHYSSAFHDFEHHGWQEVAHRYHDSFSSVTTQSIGALLDSVGAAKGTRLLDVACGPGYVAAAAWERGANVLGIDFSSEMVRDARRRFPSIEFEEGDAEQLPVPASSFDAVVLNFGLLHLGRPERALVEAYRVLRPGGSVGFTVWNAPEMAVGFGIVLNAIQQFGDINIPLPSGPPFFRFSDPEESRRALEAAGFSAIRHLQVPQTWRLDSADALFNIFYESSVRTAGLLRGQKADALERIRSEVRDRADGYRKGSAIELPMPATLCSAVKASAG